jgi:signal transduction histidine kinase
VSSSTQPKLRVIDGGAGAIADASMRVLWCPARYVADIHGEDAVEQLARSCDVEVQDFWDRSRWISMEAIARFFDCLLEIVGSEEKVAEACAYRMREAYEPIRHVLAATTPTLTLVAAARTWRLVSSTSMEVVSSHRNRVRMRYRTMGPPSSESRLTCLSRRVTTGQLPTFFGLPPATCTEHSCVALGDDCCDYDFAFYTKSHWLPPLAGFLLGSGLVALVQHLGLMTLVSLLTLPILGALTGWVVELRRTYEANLRHGDQIKVALQEMAEAEAEARHELIDLHQRQRRWAGLLEEQVAERTVSLQTVLSKAQEMSEQRIVNLRGISHDLRNPMSVLMANNGFFKAQLAHEKELYEAVEENDHALAVMDRMLESLVHAARVEGAMVKVTPVQMEVGPLVEKLRRRLRALVFGRDIRVSVFDTRDVPDRFVTDPLIFERVIDNLCTNAAKYTERGSIVLELDGRPGFLVLKISDTGRGIAPERLETIFAADSSPEAERAARSLGVGLSVVVTLMGQIGGRIEVMSKVGRGTTFWAHFPLEIDASRVGAGAKRDTPAKVVSVRYSGAG